MAESDAARDLRVMLGDPRRAVLAMSGPLIISFLVVQINSFVDTSWCSMLGVDASSAVSSISPVCWIVSGIGTGLGVGASAAIAGHLGRKERGIAESTLTQTLVVGTLISLAVMPVMWVLIDPLVRMMGADDVLAECRSYIHPIVLCTLPIVMNGVVSGLLRAEGSARRSTVMLIASACLNMVLDPVLIIVLDMGLAGAGWATGISSLVSTLIGLWWYARGAMYLRPSFKGFRFNGPQIREVLYVGVPRAAESTVISFMSMVQRIFVIICGGTVGAALYNIPWRFVSLATVVSQGVGSALVPIASAALGQGDMDRAETANRYSLRLVTVLLVVFAAVLFVFADWAVIPFTLSESMAELRPEFAHVLRIYAVLIPFMGVIDVGSSVLQSLRLAQMSLAASFVRNLIIVVFLIFACRVSMDAIFWSLVAAEVVGGALMLWLARREFRRVREAGAVRTGTP